MADDGLNKDLEGTKPPEQPKKKRRWLKVLLILFALFCCLLVGVYFYISSASFVRNQVFAKVEQELNQPINSEEIHFSPFSGLELKNFSLGDDPFLKAGTIRVKYELMGFLNNQVNVDEITLEDAELNVIVNRKGELNLLSKVVRKIEDKKPENKEEKKKDKEEKPKNKEEKKVPLVNIRNINFKNLKLHVFLDSSDEEDQFELNLDNFSFSLPEISNGKDLTYELETAIRCKAGEKFNLKNGKIKISGKSHLSENLKPELFGLDILITDLDAVNEKVKLPLNTVKLLADIGIDGKKVTINDIQVMNPEKNAGVSLKGVADDKQVDLNLAIKNVDSSILDLALVPLSGSKAVMRWQQALAEVSNNQIAGFGSTVINFEGSVKGNPKESVEAAGNLNINALPMVQISQNSSVVPISTSVKYQVKNSPATNTLELQKLSIDINDPKNQLVSLDLKSPLKLDTKNNKLSSTKDDEVTFKLNRFDLNLLKAFTKESKRGAYDSGFISTELQLISRNSGSELLLNLKNFSLDDLAITNPQNQISGIGIKTSSKLTINELDKINLQDLVFTVKQNDKQLTSLKASGLINLDKIIANITFSELKVEPEIISFVPPKVVEDLGLNNINLSSDKLNVYYSKGGISAEGRTLVQNLGLSGDKFPEPNRVTTATDFKINLDENENLNIEHLDLNLTTNGKRALTVKLSGMNNSKMEVASIRFEDLRVQPGLSSLVPKELKKKFGLDNLNLDSKDLKIDRLRNKIAVKGSLFSNGLQLGGEQFEKSFALSHSTTVDLQLVPGQLIELKALNLGLQTDKNEALNLIVSATYNPGDKSLEADISNLNISPGLRTLVPGEILEKYGLLNLNGKSKQIKVSYAEGKAGFVKADFALENLGVSGTEFRPFKVSQSLDIDIAIDQSGLLRIGKFHSKTAPSFTMPIEVMAKGQVDLNFKRDDSEISLDIPSTVDLDSLMKLMKKKEQSASTGIKPADSKPADSKPADSQPANSPQAPAKKKIKMTVKTSVNEILFDSQSIKGIRATAFIDGDNYTLKEAVLQIGESVLKASGKMNNGASKSLDMNVVSSGPVDLSPINDILNKGTEKSLSGKVTIKQLNAVTSGKTNEELTNNLKAVGKIYVHDMKLKNYAASGGMDWALDNILGVNPANIDFQQGIMDVKMENSIITLNQMEFDGSSLGFNPRGTIDLKNNTYDIYLKTAAGFGGGKWIQWVLSKPDLVNLINSKTDELKKFQKRFPYDPIKKKFMLKDDYLFDRELRLTNKTKGKTPLESIAGLNHVSSEFLTGFFLDIGKEAQMKEAASIVKLLNGEGNVLDNILNIGGGILEQEMNKKKEKVDGEKSENDPVKSILDILGGGKKKKEKEQIKETPKEEEKKKKDPINKKDDLIKKIDDIFK